MNDFKLNIAVYADGADKSSMLNLNNQNNISGFTTNPTLMAKNNIIDYKSFALDILQNIKDKPISFEVFSDDFKDMKRQALEIASFGNNVNVKIPITNTLGESAIPLIKDLAHNGVKVNITAVFNLKQIKAAIKAVAGGAPCIISIFAGRIFDSGVNAVPIIKKAVKYAKQYSNIQILWASPRQVYDVVLAQECGCDIITCTNDILNKIPNLGKSLEQFSLETVQMFRNDAIKAGFTL